MAIIWSGSLIPWTDINGDPYAGAKAYFYDAGTSTPKIVYKDSALSNAHDQPVVANSGGQFAAIFIPEQVTYRLRITTAADVLLWDVDGISAPTIVPPIPPSGDTPAEKLYNTGDIKFAWRSDSPTGFVRCNGRTIGAASSGATERANDDCQALFNHLWNNDSRLVVTGGRGASSAGDWAANKTIALPDLRSTILAGLSGMGNAVSTTIPADMFTGGQTGDVLGDRVGTAKHQLTVGQLAKHTPTFTGAPLPGHSHQVGASYVGSGAASNGGYILESGTGASTSVVSAGTPTGTISQIGNDEAHPNVQPTAFIPVFIKL